MLEKVSELEYVSWELVRCVMLHVVRDRLLDMELVRCSNMRPTTTLVPGMWKKASGKLS